MKIVLTPAEQYLIEDMAHEDGGLLSGLVNKVESARRKKAEMSCVSVTVNGTEFDYLRLLLGIRWDGNRPKARRK